MGGEARSVGGNEKRGSYNDDVKSINKIIKSKRKNYDN